MPGPINVAIVSLGCAKNLVDSESVSALLIEENFHLVTDLAAADVIIVNTCGFIDSAKEESIVKLLEMAAYKQKKCRVLLAAGCLAQRYGKELLEQMPEIDGIFGTNDLSVAALAIRRALAGKRPVYLQGKYSLPDDAPRLLSTPGHTAYLKIAEGCSNRCTYCAIPAIRGPYRSRSVSALVAEASSLAEKGVKELNLIAQDITLYGSDLGEEGGLPLLLEKLAGIGGIKWLRLLYAYPERVDTGIIEIMADNDKICHYLDLPMQHGSNRILKQMGRKTTSDSLLSLLARLRSKVKDIVLRSSFIVGFPGETDNDFKQLLSFLEEACLDRAVFFAYSREEGTPAARLPDQVPQHIKRERLEAALSLQSSIAERKQKALVGSCFEAIVDGLSAQDPGYMLLRTYMQAPEVDGYIRVRNNGAKAGTVLPVKITGYEGYDLLGEIMQ